MVVDREFEKIENLPQPKALFDESSNFIIYSNLYWFWFNILGLSFIITHLISLQVIWDEIIKWWSLNKDNFNSLKRLLLCGSGESFSVTKKKMVTVDWKKIM